MVASLVLPSFLLIAWCLGHRQIIGFNLADELLEVLVDFEASAHFRSFTKEEFNRDGSCLVIITRESNWNVNCENIAW